MPVWVGTGTGKVELTDPKIGTGTGVTDVQEIYVGTGTGRTLVWFRQPLALSAAALAWDDARLTITPPGSGADSYVIFRNGTTIATNVTSAGTAQFTWDDLNTLMPSTSYTYRVQAIRGGVVVGDVTAGAITTPAYADLGLVTGTTAYNSIALSWNAKVGSIDTFELKRGSTVIYTGTGTSKTDTGLSASTTYSYTLTAKRGGVTIKTDTVSKTTPARPTSSAIAYGPAVAGGYGWAQSTAKSLTGPTITLAGGSTNYVSSWNMRINGYSGSTGKFTPVLGGVTWPTQYPSGTAAGSVAWSDIAGNNYAVGNGALATSCSTGGDSNYKSQWQAYSGGSYSSNVAVGQVNYWWYSASWVRLADGTVVNDEVVTDAEGEHLDVFQETLNDWDGNVVARRVRDKITGEVYEEWGDIEALDARIAEG